MPVTLKRADATILNAAMMRNNKFSQSIPKTV